MNHAITWAGLLEVLATIVGTVAGIIGFLMVFAGGMSDAPEAGEDTARSGCRVGVVGLIVVLGAVLMLCACAHGPKLDPAVQTVEVKVPVPVPCKADVTVHQSYSDDAAATITDIYDQVKALLVGREERDADIARLKGAVTGCGGTLK